MFIVYFGAGQAFIKTDLDISAVSSSLDRGQMAVKALITIPMYAKVIDVVQTFFSKWRSRSSSLVAGQHNATALQDSTGSVRVEMGKKSGRVFEMHKKVLSVGRLPENDIFLEDVAISRLHASILNRGDGNYILVDEGSVNGTKVNGQKVEKYQHYLLKEGDQIQVGETVLIFSKQCAM